MFSCTTTFRVGPVQTDGSAITVVRDAYGVYRVLHPVISATASATK
jgi:hypothetical protein